MKHHTGFKMLLLGSLCCCFFLEDASAESIQEKAVAQFQEKQYAEALDIWYGIVQSGHPSAGVYYNIGVTESLLDNTPKAILAFEQALRLKPMSREINSALVETRKKIEQGAIPVSPFFLKQWYRYILSLLRPGYWALFGLTVLVVAVLVFLGRLYRLTPRRFISTQKRNVLVVIGIVLLFLAWLSYKQIYRTDEAIIEVMCEFKQAPSFESPLIRLLYPGEKVVITDEIGDWYNVNLLNLDAGWVQKEYLMPIRIYWE